MQIRYKQNGEEILDKSVKLLYCHTGMKQVQAQNHDNALSES